MNPFLAKPSLQRPPVRSFKLHQHLAFEQVEEDALNFDRCGRLEFAGERFRALAREAGKRMHGEIAGHKISGITARRCAAQSTEIHAAREKCKSSRGAQCRFAPGGECAFIPREFPTPMPHDPAAADVRKAHPFHMYDAILAQPALCAQLLAGQRSVLERAAAAAAERKRLLLTGLGTSHHAALVAAHFLRRLSGGNATPVIEQAFEWIHYPYAVGSKDAAILISHGGSNLYLIRTKEFFQSAGALTIAITGTNSAEAIRSCDFLIDTCDQEKSGAHTKSYTTTLAALAHFCVEYAHHNRFLENHSVMRAAVERVPERMRRALACEGKARGIARQAARRERWFFIGAGPNWPTACEAALKMKETSYLRAEGCETEQFLHGPIAELDARCCVCAFLTGGPADERTRQLLRAAGETEALRIAIASAQLKDVPAEHILEVPHGEEWLSPMVVIIAAQFLCYFVALERGANPDTSRRDQPAHAAAHKHFEL